MNERRWLFLGWSAVAAAMIPLFVFRAFAVDWVNHVWLTGHYAATLRETGHFPSMLDATYLETGWPSFYGYLFYPLLSLPALVLGPDLTVRIAAIVSLAAAFEVWRRVGRQLSGPGLPAVLCGLAVAVHPYVLTNLYNRSALTEFFGLEWLALVLAAVVRWIAQDAWPRRAPAWCIVAAFVGAALVAGTHPITIYLGALVLGPIVVAFAVGRGWRPDRAQLGWALVGLAMVVLLNFQWARDSLAWKSRMTLSSSDIDYTSRFDGALQRFSPVPVDPRMWQEDWAHWRNYTPFLEAPWNWLLGVAAIAIAARVWRQRNEGGDRPPLRWVVAFGVILAVLALGVGVSSSPHLGTRSATIDRVVQALFHPMQFTYRIVGPLQLGLVVLLLLAPRATATRRPVLIRVGWLRAALAVAVLGIAVKVGVTCVFLPQLQRGVIDWAVNDYWNILARSSERPGCFYGMWGYALMGEHDAQLSHVTAVDAELRLARDPRRPWRSLDLSVEEVRGKLVGTNVVAAPFMRLFVDGRPVPNSALGDPEHRFVLRIPAEAQRLHASIPPQRHLWLNLLPWLWLAAATGVTTLAWREFARRRASGRAER